MPESWGEPSPGPSPNYPDAFFEEVVPGEPTEPVDDGDESQLVRSASIGKRGKPHLVMNKGTSIGVGSQRPGPSPVQADPFAAGTGLVEASSSESTIPSVTVDGVTPAVTSDAAVADASDVATSRRYSRLSAIRRPPKIDTESTDKTTTRGSITSLPDLIRRATRLAAMIDRGKRPASRFDDFDYPDEKAAARESQRYSSELGRRMRRVVCGMLTVGNSVG